MVSVIIILLGLILGSFASVLVYRIPYGGSILTPVRSECPKCRSKISFYDNIPVISYIMLKGRCRKCNVKIPIIYLVLELITPILFLFVYNFSSATIGDIVFKISVVYILILISFTDIVTSLDDKFTSGMIPEIYLIILILLPLIDAGFLRVGDLYFSNRLMGFAAGFLLLYLLSATMRVIFKRDSMGDGDIILFGAIIMCIPYYNATELVLHISFILIVSSMVGIITWLMMRYNFKKRGFSINDIRIPFAPALSVCYLVLLIF